MEKFKGTLDELKARVKASGAEGDWTPIEYGHQFRNADKACLNWYEKTGTIQYQGPKAAKEKLRAALSNGAPAMTTSKASFGPAPAIPVEKPKVFVVHGHDTAARL